MLNDNVRHHSKYVSNQQVIHKCLMTYKDILSNMPFSWYVDRVEESVKRKGYTISKEEIVKSVYYFLKDDINICPHCYDGTLKGEKHK